MVIDTALSLKPNHETHKKYNQPKTKREREPLRHRRCANPFRSVNQFGKKRKKKQFCWTRHSQPNRSELHFGFHVKQVGFAQFRNALSSSYTFEKETKNKSQKFTKSMYTYIHTYIRALMPVSSATNTMNKDTGRKQYKMLKNKSDERLFLGQILGHMPRSGGAQRSYLNFGGRASSYSSPDRIRTAWYVSFVWNWAFVV